MTWDGLTAIVASRSYRVSSESVPRRGDDSELLADVMTDGDCRDGVNLVESLEQLSPVDVVRLVEDDHVGTFRDRREFVADVADGRGIAPQDAVASTRL